MRMQLLFDISTSWKHVGLKGIAVAVGGSGHKVKHVNLL